MKRDKATGDTAPPLDSGPFRKIDYDKEIAIKQMQAEIMNEGTLGVEIPAGAKEGDALPNFAETCEAIDYKHIILWSLETGLLRYANKEDEAWNPKISYTYKNAQNPEIKLTVELPKKASSSTTLFKNKTIPAIITNICTRTDVRSANRQYIEDQKQQLIDALRMHGGDTKFVQKLIETDMGIELDGVLRAELKDLKIDLERLLFTIKSKLEGNK